MNSLAKIPAYKEWLTELKKRLLVVQLKAAMTVNEELMHFYWQLGADIIQKQAETQWGDGFLGQLSQDLIAEFPEMKGFSVSNLKYMRRWHLFYAGQAAIGQQPIDQLALSPKSIPALKQITRVPWGHNITIIVKCKTIDEALFYIENTRLCLR